MKFSEATPNWAGLWSPGDRSHMKASSVHPLCRLRFLLLLTCVILPSAIASHRQGVGTERDGRANWVTMPVNFSRKRVAMLCKQSWFRNDSSPHPLPQLRNEQLHPGPQHQGRHNEPGFIFNHVTVRGDINMRKYGRRQMDMPSACSGNLLWGL